LFVFFFKVSFITSISVAQQLVIRKGEFVEVEAANWTSFVDELWQRRLFLQADGRLSVTGDGVVNGANPKD